MPELCLLIYIYNAIHYTHYGIYLHTYIHIYMGALLTCKKCVLHRQVKPTAELDKCAQQLKDIKVSPCSLLSVLEHFKVYR